MTTEEIIEEIKLQLTGGVLQLEIEDATIEKIIKKSLRELERFWDETKLITVPFAGCIDTSGFNSSSIVKVYRVDSYGMVQDTNVYTDPLIAQQWLIFSNGGTMYNLNDYILNYASWATFLKIKNTMSTDMAFMQNKHDHKLYINQAMDRPKMITIQYIPKLEKPQDIQSDYWIDILVRMSMAQTKVILGHIRTRFAQSNALWTQDGDAMLQDGKTTLSELREVLRTNSNLVYPLD